MGLNFLHARFQPSGNVFKGNSLLNGLIDQKGFPFARFYLKPVAIYSQKNSSCCKGDTLVPIYKTMVLNEALQ